MAQLTLERTGSELTKAGSVASPRPLRFCGESIRAHDQWQEHVP